MSNHNNQKGNTISKRRISGLVVGLAILTTLFVLTAFFIVTPLKREITLEAGEELTLEPTAYFQASDIALPFLKVEKEVNDTDRVGEDTLVYSYLHFWKFTVNVHIVDTTPPDFTITDTEIGVTPGERLCAKDFVSTIHDNAEGTQTVTFASYDTEISYDTYGRFENMICVTDESGNVSQEPITIWVAEAPVLKAPTVYYVVQTSLGYAPEEFLASVGVTDAQDGEAIEQSLSIVVTDFDSDKEGTYEAQISAVNSYHVATTVNVPVYVVAEDKMTEALMEDEPALLGGEVLSKDTGEELEKLQDNNLQEAEALVQPTLVSIYYSLADNAYAYGNGFVIDITEDAVYIASNYHVLAAFADSRAELTFYNGYRTSEYTFIGGSEEDDVAFLKIERTSFPVEIFDYLREPKISLARAWTIEQGAELFRTSCFINKPNHTQEGTFLSYEQQIFNGDRYTTFTVAMEQGDSGSAIYDGHGYLISMCAGVAHEDDDNIMCGVRLERIVSEYERLSGNKLFAY